MPIRWTHITINVSDLDRSVEFYTSFCGLMIVRDRRLEGRHDVWLGPPTAIGGDPPFVVVMVRDDVNGYNFADLATRSRAHLNRAFDGADFTAHDSGD